MHRVTLCLSALALSTSAALAVGTLDQSNLPAPTGNFSAIFTSAASAPTTVTQTFTVGLTGQLSQIDVMLDPRNSPTAPVNLDVFATAAGVPTGPSLASASIPSFNTPNTLVSFDLTPSLLPVLPGQVLAFTLSSPGPGGTDYLVRIVPNNTYAPGAASNSAGTIGAGFDTIFQTYVLVPEPTSLAACTLTLLTLLPRRRRA